jgi:hypothetical protein
MDCAKAIGMGVLFMWVLGVVAIGLAFGANWLENQIGAPGTAFVLMTVIGVIGGGAACIASRR